MRDFTAVSILWLYRGSQHDQARLIRALALALAIAPDAECSEMQWPAVSSALSVSTMMTNRFCRGSQRMLVSMIPPGSLVAAFYGGPRTIRYVNWALGCSARCALDDHN